MSNTLAYCKKDLIVQKNFMVQVPYSQQSIVFVNYESAQKARLFPNTKLERLTGAKHSNLLDQCISYGENEVL